MILEGVIGRSAAWSLSCPVAGMWLVSLGNHLGSECVSNESLNQAAAVQIKQNKTKLSGLCM